MAHLNHKNKNGMPHKMRTTLNPSALLEIFSKHVDFSNQPRKPIGTVSLSPYQETWKVVGWIDASGSTLKLRYDSQLSEGKTILLVSMKEAQQGGTEVGLSFERAPMNRFEKIVLMASAVFFWGLLLGIVALIRDNLLLSEALQAIGSGLLMTISAVTLGVLFSHLEFRRDVIRLTRFAKKVIGDANRAAS